MLRLTIRCSFLYLYINADNLLHVTPPLSSFSLLALLTILYALQNNTKLHKILIKKVACTPAHRAERLCVCCR